MIASFLEEILFCVLMVETSLLLNSRLYAKCGRLPSLDFDGGHSSLSGSAGIRRRR